MIRVLSHYTGGRVEDATLNGHFGFGRQEKKKKTRIGKSHGYREVIVFKKVRFQNVNFPDENAKPAFSTSSCLKSVSESSVFVKD